MMRVIICGILGMRDTVSAATSNSAAVAVRKFFQPILEVSRMEAKTVTKGGLNNDRTIGKAKVRLEGVRDVQFRWRWEALMNVCLNKGGMNNTPPGGTLWGDLR